MCFSMTQKKTIANRNVMSMPFYMTILQEDTPSSAKTNDPKEISVVELLIPDTVT